MSSHLKYLVASAFSLSVLASVSHAQTNPPAWSPTTSYKIGDLVSYEGVTFQCLINETTSHPTPHTLSWGINYVYSGTLPIPIGPNEVVHTLAQAWTYISGARIANNSAIQLKLDSNYNDTFTSSFSLDHPYGSRISIIGLNNGALATFSHASAGFTLDAGFHFADIEGFEMIAPNSGSGGNPAIQVSQNASLLKLKNMSIQRFDTGISADSALIDNVSGIQLGQFINGGVEAADNATINIVSPITIDGAATTSLTPPNFAFYSLTGATINCRGCVGQNCLYGFEATQGGRIIAPSSSSVNTLSNLSAAFFATEKGYLNADSSSASGCPFSYESANGAFLSAISSDSTNAGAEDYYAATGGSIDASNERGNAGFSHGTNDGSYIYGV